MRLRSHKKPPAALGSCALVVLDPAMPPELLDARFQELEEAGLDCLLLRQGRSADHVGLANSVVETAAAHGLETLIEVEVTKLGCDALTDHPDWRQQVLVWEVAAVADGRVPVPAENLSEAEAPAPRAELELYRAYVRADREVTEVTAQVSLSPSAADLAAVWDPAGIAGDEMAVFFRRTVDSLDLARLDAARLARSRVSQARRDFPAAAGLWYEAPSDGRSGEHLLPLSEAGLREFQDRHAYDLRKHLPSLCWELPDSGAVRAAVTSTVADLQFRVQSMIRTEAARVFGPEVRVLPVPAADCHSALPAPALGDPFRTAFACQTSAVTRIAEGDDPRFPLALGRSLGKYCCGNSALGLTGGERVQATEVDWLTSLVSPLFSDGDQALANARVSQRLAWVRERLEPGAPRANLGVVYNWRTAACLKDGLATEYRRSLAGLTSALTKSGHAFDILSPDLLSSAEDMTDDGGVTRKEETYAAIIYPWPVAHTSLDWEILLGFLDEGGRAILVGLPPDFPDAEAAVAFGKAFGITPPSAADFHPIRCPLELFGQTVPVVDTGLAAPLDIDGAPLRTTAGMPLGVPNERGSAWYLSMDAGRMAPTVVTRLLSAIGVTRLVDCAPHIHAALVGDKLLCCAEGGRSLAGETVAVGERGVTFEVDTDLALVSLETGNLDPWIG